MYTIRMMDKKFLDTFGKRVYYIRRDSGFTTQTSFLDALEKQTGVKVSQGHWSAIEKSDQVPNGRIVVAVADVLQTTTDFLLLRTDDPFLPGDENKPAFITLEAEQIANVVDEIRSDRRRQEALHLAEALLAEDERDKAAAGVEDSLTAFDRLLALVQERHPETFSNLVEELRTDLGLNERSAVS